MPILRHFYPVLRPVRLVAWLLLASLLLPSAGVLAVGVHATLPALGDTERTVLSPVMERRLGERIMRDIRREQAYIDDEVVAEYLNNLGQSLIELSPDVRGEAGYDYLFFALRDPTLNAFALPGGFIGFHSGLIMAAESESELASVFAHEIGHVAQRHIARIIGEQQNNSMIQLASMLLGAVVATAAKSTDGAIAAAMGGAGLAVQRQLDFSRMAEREADRIGLEILSRGGYDTSGMVGFFARMQHANRNVDHGMPSVLMTHPLTTERIADIEARIRGTRYRQRADSPDFNLIRARVRVLQNSHAQGARDNAVYFENLLRQNDPDDVRAGHYGLALVALKQQAYAKSWQHLHAGKAVVPVASTLAYAQLEAELLLAERKYPQAISFLERAREQFPVSRAVVHQYAEALMAGGRLVQAQDYLREQVRMYRQDDKLLYTLARVYERKGKRALQHMALADAYALTGSLPAALEQLAIARRMKDATFYDLSVIDAREKELRRQWDNDKADGLG